MIRGERIQAIQFLKIFRLAASQPKRMVSKT
jgi:hypothetical protein